MVNTADALPAAAEDYAEVARQIAGLIAGEADRIACMASIACLLHHGFERFFWTGFYIVDPAKGDELVVGPYQGTPGCMRIPFGQGVCGTAAATGKTQIVADVHAIENHIACDSRSRSEIVVPVFDAESRLIAVLDIDSTAPNAFDETDAQWLEQIVRKSFS